MPEHFGQMLRRPLRVSVPIGLVGALVPASALAHTTGDVVGGLLAGVIHPLSGLDHVLAMVAVGLWGAQLGSPALWLLPVTFPAVMALGGAVGIAGLPFPAVEVGIALSAIALGTMVATSARPRLGVAAVLVGAFAVVHGYAHGAELPASASPLGYSLGFVAATGCLHASGIAIGTIVRWPLGARLLRVGGVAIGIAGVFFLARAVGLP